jgi:hypothetical protein
MNSGNLDSRDVATKRDDPDFAQVSGYIPKAKALRFKVTCTALQTSQSEALDEAISLWLEKQESLSSVMGEEQEKKSQNTSEKRQKK